MEENKKYATCKEFAKMLRAVADIFDECGNTPLYDVTPDVKEKAYYVTNRGAYDAYIDPWMRNFAENPIEILTDDYEETPCNTDCIHYRQGTCPFNYYNKQEECPRFK